MSRKTSNPPLSLEARLAIVVADIEAGLTLKQRIAIEKEHGVCRHYQKQVKRFRRAWFVQTREIVVEFMRYQRRTN